MTVNSFSGAEQNLQALSLNDANMQNLDVDASRKRKGELLESIPKFLHLPPEPPPESAPRAPVVRRRHLFSTVHPAGAGTPINSADTLAQAVSAFHFQPPQPSSN